MDAAFRLMPACMASVLVAMVLAPAGAGAAYDPTPGAPYTDGPTGRYKLDGTWFLKRDADNAGLDSRWQRSRTFTPAAGWQPITVPNAFNAGDLSDAGYNGATAWYATEFNRPSGFSTRRWILHFDAVNHKARVWLNGREIGRHTGGFLPFELNAAKLKGGVNRLVVRVDNRLSKFTVPQTEVRTEMITGGWWNYGGILREVGLRRVGRIDISSVTTRSSFKKAGAPAKITVLARVTNYGRKRARLRLSGRFGGAPIRFRTVILRRGASVEVTGVATIKRPRLWQPQSPTLYPVSVRGGGAGYRQLAGIRRLKVSKNGILTLNGRKTQFRGVSFHEADEQVGAAWTPIQRAENLGLITQLGANMIRSHYPLSPVTMEWADRNGVFVWVQAPVFRPREHQIKSNIHRRYAVNFTREMVLAYRAHPSVLVWSLMNEPLPQSAGPIDRLVRAQRKIAKQLDPQGLTGIDWASAPEDDLQHQAFRRVEVLGVNEYFGWYPGSLGSTVSIDRLVPYLDQLRQAYGRQAMFITEFGTEANREGPADELGTYSYQTNFLLTHMNIFRGLPYLNGYFAWALRDYPVRPGWTGGNPDPTPPYSRKGLFALDGSPKPAAAEVEREFRATPVFK